MRAKTDREIAEAVHHAMIEDIAIPDRTIDVTVSDGWVRLTGSVALAAEREEAERVVWRVPAVRAVTNEIAVWPDDLQSAVVRETIEGAVERRGE